MSNFKNELEQEVEFINDLILRYLPDETGLDKKIREAMNYSRKVIAVVAAAAFAGAVLAVILIARTPMPL